MRHTANRRGQCSRPDGGGQEESGGKLAVPPKRLSAGYRWPRLLPRPDCPVSGQPMGRPLEPVRRDTDNPTRSDRRHADPRAAPFAQLSHPVRTTRHSSPGICAPHNDHQGQTGEKQLAQHDQPPAVTANSTRMVDAPTALSSSLRWRRIREQTAILSAQIRLPDGRHSLRPVPRQPSQAVPSLRLNHAALRAPTAIPLPPPSPFWPDPSSFPRPGQSSRAARFSDHGLRSSCAGYDTLGSMDITQSIAAKVMVSPYKMSPGPLSALKRLLWSRIGGRSCSADHLVRRKDSRFQMAK